MFFFPAAQVAETEGSFTNTQRMLQWHFKAADPPGDCRTDLWFTYQLGERLKRLYADSTLPRDQGFKNLIWDFEPDGPDREHGSRASRTSTRSCRRSTATTPAAGKHLAGFGDLKDDGSTTCASWIYCGVFPAPDRNLAASKEPDPPGIAGVAPNWGFAWPANRRLLYNRASADLRRAAVERAEEVGLVGRRSSGPATTCRTSRSPSRPTRRADPDGIGLDGSLRQPTRSS